MGERSAADTDTVNRQSSMRRCGAGVLAAFVLGAWLGGGGLATAQGKKAEEALEAGDWPEAVKQILKDPYQKKKKNWCVNAFLLGFAYLQNGQPAESLATFDDLVNAKELNCYTFGLVPAWHFWRGMAQVRNGKIQESIASFQNAAALAPATLPADFFPEWKLRFLQPTKDQCYLLLGRSQMERRAYQDAVVSFQKAIEVNPRQADYFSWLARAHLSLRQNDEALAAARRGAELGQGAFQFRVLGDVYAARRQYDDAVAAYRQGLAKAPTDREMLDAVAGTLLGAGRDEAALEAYAAEAAVLPAHPVPYFYMGFIRARQGKFDEARAALDKAIAVAGGSGGNTAAAPVDKGFVAACYGFRSLVDRELGQRDAAAKDAEQGRALNPDAGWVRLAEGALALDEGSYDAAIEKLASLKDDVLARLFEATAHAGKGDAARAVDIYGSLPAAGDLDQSAVHRRARLALVRALHGYAQANLDKARADQAAGRPADALTGYAAAIRASDEETAAAIRQRVAALFKDHPALAELPEDARKYALRGEVLAKEGALGEALEQYRQALRLAPLSPRLHHDIAEVQGRLEAYRQAIASMNAYLELSPDAPDARAARDDIYRWEFALERASKK
jgi:tetratricopeptide (TPR) repeat protein